MVEAEQTVLPQSGWLLVTVRTDDPNFIYTVWFTTDGRVCTFTNYYGELYDNSSHK